MLSINRSKRSRGRPRKDSEAILVRLPQNLLEGVDQHIKKSTESIGRPEAIRQLLAIAGSRTPPPNWGADALSKFMDWAYASRWATFYRVHSEFERLIGIDSCFLDLFKASKWTDPKRLIEVGLLARCHSAYRAACENATAGQLAEVYAQLRACLE